MIPVEISRIVIADNRALHPIWLKEKAGTRSFPILIGVYEALAIQRKINGEAVARPLTHDLLASVIDGMDGRLTRVEVHTLSEQTFYAKLVIEHGGGTAEIDSRPSDALALAVRKEAPIFVSEEVMDEVATEPSVEA